MRRSGRSRPSARSRRRPPRPPAPGERDCSARESTGRHRAARRSARRPGGRHIPRTAPLSWPPTGLASVSVSYVSSEHQPSAPAAALPDAFASFPARRPERGRLQSSEGRRSLSRTQSALRKARGGGSFGGGAQGRPNVSDELPTAAGTVVTEPGSRCLPGESNDGVCFSVIDRPSSPRFLDVGSPLCPNCTQSPGRKILMKGPVPDPAGSTDQLFVCERCKTMMKDRRSASETPEGG